MRASTAFLAGIGTVGVAIAGGLGGGLWIANMMNPHASKYGLEAATFDRQALPASAALPYVGATLAFMAPGVDGRAPARDQRADSGNAAPRPAEAKASTDQPARSADAGAVKQPSQDARTPATAAAKPASPPEDAYAKAGDSDLKHQADRRHAERAQRWANRHRRDQPNQQSQQDQDNSDQQASTDSEGNSRNNSGGKYSQRHSYRGYRESRPRYRDAERWYPDDREQRYYAEDPPPVDLPQVRLLGPDD